MPASDSDLFAFFDAHGIAHHTIDHPPLFTVEDSQALRGDLPGGHAKNLFLKDKKGGLWLVVAEEETRVDVTALEKHLGAPRLSFGKPDLLLEILGVIPGSVTPFGLVNETARAVRLVLDSALLRHDHLHFHPLRNDRTTGISRAGLEAFLATVGIAPLVVDLAAVAEARAVAKAS